MSGGFYSDYDVFLLFIFYYVSQSAFVFTQYVIGGAWKRFFDNILITMITSIIELIVLYTSNQVFAVLVVHFDADDWQEGAERN